MKIKEFVEKFKQRKKLYRAYQILLYVFAIYGFGLTFVFFGIKMHLFDDPGGVDQNDRYFQLADEANLKNDSTYFPISETTEFMNTMNVLNQLYPKNARLIYNAFLNHHDINIAMHAVEAVKIRLQDNQEFQSMMKNPYSVLKKKGGTNANSLFEWMNVEEWEYFKAAVEKDVKVIDSVADLTEVDHRLIVAALVGEQMRLFNSRRETYKTVMRPLKILSVESQFSLGVTGIKDFNAAKVEAYLKDSASEYYLGKKYEHLLDFKTTDPTTERYNRLVDYRNHFWSYMYAAIIIKQFETQWKKAGYDISDRPEILITLFNVGFPQSHPGPNPKVGGSHVNINGINYSFGSLGFEFYYSGEMAEVFPYKKRKDANVNSNLTITYSLPKEGPAPGSWKKKDSTQIGGNPPDSAK